MLLLFKPTWAGGSQSSQLAPLRPLTLDPVFLEAPTLTAQTKHIKMFFLISVFCVFCCVFCSEDLPLSHHPGQPATFSIHSVTKPVRSQETLLSLALYSANQRQPLSEFQAAVWGCVAASLRDRAGVLEDGKGVSPRSLLVSKKAYQRLKLTCQVLPPREHDNHCFLLKEKGQIWASLVVMHFSG